MSRKLLLAFLLLFVVSACKKEDNPANPGGGTSPNSFTVNGAGYNNRTFTVPSSLNNPFFPAPALGSYNPKDSATLCVQIVEVLSKDSLLTACLTAFLSNQTGNFQSSARAAGSELYVEGRKFVGGSDGIDLISGTSMTINVTRYDAPGGRIQGSYNGTLREEVNGTLTNTTISLTGNFDVLNIASSSAVE